MLRKKISKILGLPIQDFASGTKILSTMRFLNESQYWDEQRLRDYQTIKLIKLVDYAYNNVPYYQESFDKEKLKPSDIHKLDDIEKIPLLTKEDFRLNNYRLISKT